MSTISSLPFRKNYRKRATQPKPISNRKHPSAIIRRRIHDSCCNFAMQYRVNWPKQIHLINTWNNRLFSTTPHLLAGRVFPTFWPYMEMEHRLTRELHTERTTYVINPPFPRSKMHAVSTVSAIISAVGDLRLRVYILRFVWRHNYDIDDRVSQKIPPLSFRLSHLVASRLIKNCHNLFPKFIIVIKRRFFQIKKKSK